MCNSFKNFESCCFNFEPCDRWQQNQGCGCWNNPFDCGRRDGDFKKDDRFGGKEFGDSKRGYGFEDNFKSQNHCQCNPCHNQRPCQCRPCNPKKCCIEINWRCF